MVSTRARISSLLHSRAPTAMPATSPPGRTRNVAGNPVTRQAREVRSSASSRIGNVSFWFRAPGSRSVRGAPRSTDRPRTTRPRSRYSRHSVSSVGISSRHGSHQVAQKFTTTSLSAWSASVAARPSSVASRTGGPCWPSVSSVTPAFSNGSSGGAACCAWWPPSSPGRLSGSAQSRAPRRRTASPARASVGYRRSPMRLRARRGDRRSSAGSAQASLPGGGSEGAVEAPFDGLDAQLLTGHRTLPQLRRRGREHDRPLLHNIAAVAHGQGHSRVLLDEEHRDPEALELGDHVTDQADERGGEPLRGLVHQDQPCPCHHHARDREHLLLTSRERLAWLLQPLGEAREVVEHLLEPATAERRRTVGDGREAQLEVLAHRQPREDAPALRHEPDPEARDLVGGEPGEVVAVELDRPAPRLEKAHRGLHERGLAHAVPAEQRDGVARRDFE